ncbi:MAG: xylulokinase [Anaerolineae bacterium]|jgi:xylulokinase|nr:xylulokinase [Anaerolineae bacterium]
MRFNKQRPDVVLGIDVGTQSTKCVVLDETGQLLGVGQEGYGVQMPRPNWAEQDPDTWWQAAISAVQAALQYAKIAADQVCGIGLAGQMHGVVLLGADLFPLRPAIIWMDRRSANLCATVQARVPPEAAVNIAGNQLSPGFAGASLAWLREVEPGMLEQTRTVVQPKDYLALQLTGEISSDHSDASATWLYDITQRCWSETLAAACGVPLDILPPLYDSGQVVGMLRPEAADVLGLKPGIPVVAGAGDQAALLLGAGVVEAGRGSITLGTGGQITVVSNRPRIASDLRLNTFCHAVPERWYTMGAILNGGLVLRWWRGVVSPNNSLPFPDLLARAEAIPAGAEGLIFLPYLEGERTPHMDPDATGAFVGLTRRHSQEHLTRAVLEGVAYAFRDCLQTLQAAGPVPDHFLVGGGGSQSAVWRRILASVLGVSLQTVEGKEHTAIGAALLAGLGADVFYDLAQAVARAVRYGSTETPDPDEQARYAELHAQFQALYPALRAVR